MEKFYVATLQIEHFDLTMRVTIPTKKEKGLEIVQAYFPNSEVVEQQVASYEIDGCIDVMFVNKEEITEEEFNILNKFK